MSADTEPSPELAALLNAWTDRVRLRLGIGQDLAVNELLETARDVAHLVARPATPLTTYLMGLAVGAGADPGEVNSAIRELLVDSSPE